MWGIPRREVARLLELLGGVVKLLETQCQAKQCSKLTLHAPVLHGLIFGVGVALTITPLQKNTRWWNQAIYIK